MLEGTYKQADEFLKTYREDLTEQQVEILEAYTKIPYLSKIRKLIVLFKYKFFKHGLKRKLGQIIFS